MGVTLLTTANRGDYLSRIQSAIGDAEHFTLVTAFATSDGIELLEPSMRNCLERGGTGRVVLALDRQHFNSVGVFVALGGLKREFGAKLEVSLVEEAAGLLHAKALFAKGRTGADIMIVGSANLTERAFYNNHELGVAADLHGPEGGDVARKLQLFVRDIHARPLSVEAIQMLVARLRPPPPIKGETGPSPPPGPGLAEILTSLPPSPGLGRLPINTFVADWIGAGYIVGRGRRGLDVLVMRAPAEQLEQRHLIAREARTRIAAATEKTVSAGYGIRLLPDEEDRALRDQMRRMVQLLTKLTLNLPCFGLWLPRSFWAVFEEAKAALESLRIAPNAIFEAATRRRAELEGAGLEQQVDAIVGDLDRADLRRAMLDYFRDQLRRRTPELLAHAVEFRTQRQSVAPADVDQQVAARWFFVDLMQATLASTYRTGAWPRRIRSRVARSLAGRLATRVVKAGQEPTDTHALQLLDGSARWEHDSVTFEEVRSEVERLLGEAGTFDPPAVSELVRAADEDDGGDEGGDHGLE